MELKFILKYNVKEDEFDDSRGNITDPEARESIVRDFLRIQPNRKDDVEPNIKEDYTIMISSNFNARDNCKNKDLRNGILRRYLFKKC